MDKIVMKEIQWRNKGYLGKVGKCNAKNGFDPTKSNVNP